MKKTEDSGGWAERLFIAGGVEWRVLVFGVQGFMKKGNPSEAQIARFRVFDFGVLGETQFWGWGRLVCSENGCEALGNNFASIQ